MIYLAWLLALLSVATPVGFFLCCCGDCGSIHATVTGCGVPLAGVVVTVTGPGGFSATCTTDGSGQCSVPITATGTYGVAVTAPAHFDTPAGVLVTVSTCVTGSVHNATITLTPSTGYSCTPDCCAGQTGPPYQLVTWPDPIFLNDGFGTVTLSLTVLTGNRPLWTGVATRTAANAFDCNFNNGSTVTCGKLQASQSVTLHFSVGCSATAGKLFATVGYYPCSNFSTSPGCAFSPGSCGHTDYVAVVEDLNCGCTAGAVTCGANFPCCVQGAVGHGNAHGLRSTDDDLPCPPSAVAASVTVSCSTGGGGLGDTVCNALSEVYGGPPMSVSFAISS